MTWDPVQYGRFTAERRQPFDDLLALCEPVPGGRAVDLGCGSGERTVELHRAMGAARTTGVDRSAAMLGAAPPMPNGVELVEGAIEDVAVTGADLVFANASLHWVDDHPALLRRLRAMLAPGGQLAVQVPDNWSHSSHRLARQVAAAPPFATMLGGTLPPDPGERVLAPEHYATVLHELGADRQHVRLQVYGHELASTAEVVSWVTGTLLTPYRERLGEDGWAAFLDAYRGALVAQLGDRRPYFYTYRRILAWARFGTATGTSAPSGR